VKFDLSVELGRIISGNRNWTTWTVSTPHLEMLVREVARQCAEIADKAEPYKAGELIRKHFGVEHDQAET
jgi:hypothetical protein